MTESEMQQLSREVSEKVGIEPFFLEKLDLAKFSPHLSPSPNPDYSSFWLHNDNARCFRLMVKYKIDITPCSRIVFADMDSGNQSENYSDHNNDAELATRIAILKAVMEIA